MPASYVQVHQVGREELLNKNEFSRFFAVKTWFSKKKIAGLFRKNRSELVDSS